MKQISAFLLAAILLLRPIFLMAEENVTETTAPSALDVEAPSAILMEASTGTVLFEKNAHERLRPASVTKVMTLLLIFEALEKGQIQLDDYVTVSEHASSMGGSQVYLETGETQSVNDLIKCISIASANDACVAMAEFIDGTEDAFVVHMNEKAQSLGMNDTTFANCCGLEAEGHLTSAYDIALMSRELSVRHPEIFNYCTIWMDHITHTTRKGTSEFGLTNTNKLIRHYDYVTGLKTGFTRLAKYCLAATASKNDVNLISVVMAEESIDARTKDTISLLDYGFAHCNIYTDENKETLPQIAVKKGTAETVPIQYDNMFQYIITDGTSADSIEKTLEFPQEIEAPVKAGDIAGKAVYRMNGREIGAVNIRFAEDVPKAGIKDSFLSTILIFFLAE